MRLLLRGIAAGVAGTATMTAYQLAVAKLRGRPLQTRIPRTWADAPAPAKVAKKAADAVGEGRHVTKKDVPLLTNAVHWGYGAALGAVYALAARRLELDPVVGGLAFGVGVWSAAYAELVPLGVYDPPWRYPPKELALDLSYHLVYGLGVAESFAQL